MTATSAVATAPRERIVLALRAAAKHGQPALVAFLTAGFPSREKFREHLTAVEGKGGPELFENPLGYNSGIVLIANALYQNGELIAAQPRHGVALAHPSPHPIGGGAQQRVPDGVAERMRSEGYKQTPFAALSRGVCGVRGNTLILNLPGSPSGAVESLQAVLELVPHALNLLDGKTEHS